MTEEHSFMRNDKSYPNKDLQGVVQLPFVLKGRQSVLEVQGPDSLDLLNRLSTNKLIGTASGDVVETILTTEKGRVLDVLLALVKDDGLYLVVTEAKRDDVLQWLEKYTIMEDVKYISHSHDFDVYNIIGMSDSKQSQRSSWHWETEAFGIKGAISVAHESIRGAGQTVLVPHEKAEEFDSLIDTGNREKLVRAREIDYRLWRIANTIPDVGFELTEQVNPLEAGAKAAVDFEKGCYIGQEVIARLDSYDKVQRKLVKIEFDSADHFEAESGTLITSDGKNAGFLTTIEYDPVKGKTVGLACIRHAFSTPDSQLSIHVDDNSRTLHVV